MTSPYAATESAPAAAAQTVDLTGYRYWLVPHTHWDREWYLPFESFRLQLVRMVDELVDVLEADPRMVFSLDGQAVLLEDYAETNPHRLERLQALIRAGRIAIGPCYVLPDEFIIGAESHVRNLLAGARVCRRFGGEPSRAGYIPDTFGHIAQLPQILRGFGLDSFLFQRGLGDETFELGTTFTWAAPDGSEVQAMVLFEEGYSNGPEFGRWTKRGGKVRLHDQPERWPDLAAERAREIVENYHDRLAVSDQRDIVICNGTDHRRVQTDLPEMVEACRARIPEATFTIATYDQFVEAMRGCSPTTRFTGQLVGGLEHQITRGVNSTRMYLKQLNEHTERLLYAADALAALAWMTGRYDHPTGMLDLAWRELLRTHPHDSICGCSIDEVHRDMLPRFASAQQIVAAVQREALAAIAGRPATWTFAGERTAEQTALNLLAWRRRGLVRLTVPDELTATSAVDNEPGTSLVAELADGTTLAVQHVDPSEADGVGGSVAAIVELDGLSSAPVTLRPMQPGDVTRVVAETGDDACVRAVSERAIENELYRVEVAANGTVSVTQLATGDRLEGLNLFEDQADRGDEYNFNELEGEQPWTSADLVADVRVVVDGPLFAELEITLDAELPEGLSEDRTQRIGTTPVTLTTRVRLTAGIDRVEFTTTVDNTARDHRLRVCFPCGPHEGPVRAEGHFDIVDKPVTIDWGSSWIEPPQPTHHTAGLVTAGALALFNRGLPEYESRVDATGGVTLALTLLRCVGWLSRGDIPARPYNAGPPLATPEAQCLGSHSFEYAVRPCTAQERSQGWPLLRAAHGYRHDLVTGLRGADINGLVELDGEGWTMSALKLAEAGDGVVARLSNPTDTPAQVRVGSSVPSSLVRCRLDETERVEVEPHVTVAPQRIETLLLAPTR